MVQALSMRICELHCPPKASAAHVQRDKVVTIDAADAVFALAF